MWDVETLLADRHRAKIEALEKPRSRWGARWLVTKELADAWFVFIGKIATAFLLGVWLLTGSPLGFLH
jgi:hypothetical protein